MLMCKKDEALFGWIEVEKPIKWTFIQKKNQKIEKEKIKKIKKSKREKEKEFICSGFE